MKQAKRVAFHNLGCKVNSYELDLIRQSFADAGYLVVDFAESADVYVVNTCTVTNIADRKSRQMLHRAKKKNPAALVVAVGCYVETDPEKTQMEEAIDLAIDNRAKRQTLARVEELLAEREKGNAPGPRIIRGEASVFDGGVGLSEPGRTRADIKIQDGCNQFCSYCIIPYARGRIVSREEEDTLAEIRALAEAGVREVVLVGIHVSSYGKDRGEEPEEALLRLLTKIQMLQGIRRIRLSSLEPRIMTERFVKGIAALSKLCPHFHLSLQSGCDRTLREMNRRYTTAEYAESAARLRRYFDRPALVGFPGETEEDFAKTLAFAEAMAFYQIHVFKYSRREGTVAAARTDQVPEAVKAARSARLLELTKAQALGYRERFLGEEDVVLLEEEIAQEGRIYLRGHTARYVETLVPAAPGAASGALARGVLQKGPGECLLLEGATFE